MPLLVLDATPVQVLTDHLASRHSRLPEITASIRIPGNVTVVQYAASSNGHAVLSDPRHRQRVGKQVAVERDTHPVTSPDKEAVICFRSQREAMEELGFPPSQVLTFGSARGSNALANVERDLLALAQVVEGATLACGHVKEELLAVILHDETESAVREFLDLTVSHSATCWLCSLRPSFAENADVPLRGTNARM